MKKLQSLILIFALIINLTVPFIANATRVSAETNDISDETIQQIEALEELESTELLKNRDFTESESAGNFKEMWAEDKKPTYWDLRNWGSSGGEDPKASMIQDGENPLVQIELNKTVGFFQYHESIPVDAQRKYEFNAKVKTKDVQTLHGSKNAISLRIEQLDSKDALVQREDIAFVQNHSGDSEWTDLSGSVETASGTTQIRVILVLGNVSAGNGSTGTILIDSMSMKGENVALESIGLTPDSLAISRGSTANLSYTLHPTNATNQDIVWSSSDNDIVTVEEGKITGLKAGTVTITVQSKENPNIEATSEIKVIDGDIAVSEIILDRKEVILSEGRGTILKPSVTPSNASNQEIVWNTSNESVVEVSEGVVKAVAPGTAIVTATSVDGKASAKTEITVKAYTDDEFDELRKKWAHNVVPNDYIDLNHPVMKLSVEELSNSAVALWDLMDTSKDRTYLWADAASPSESADVTTNYRNLSTLAKAYATKGSKLNGNPILLKDIINGLDWMNENRYNSNGHDYKNWWDWQIGSPQLLNDTVTIIYEYLNDDQISNYMAAIKKHVPDPTKYHGIGNSWVVEATAANLVDLIKVVSVQGVISKEEARIEKGKEHFPVIEIKKSGKGNGLYADGSFVDHSNIAYTGTYGVVFLGSMFDMVYLLEGSSYALNKADLNNIYDMILNAFQPVIYRGLMMDMVNGRAISREGPQDVGHGRGAIERIIQYIEFAPEEYKAELESMVKYWIISNGNMLEHFSRIPVISTANRIMNDANIKPRDELIKHYNLANMDRVVHRRPGYAFGLSMYSDRIGAYEGNMNGENLRAHYTASGMTYLYNNDLEQYSDGFWPTVDSYRLPGTTVDATKQLAAGQGTAKTSPQSWVGGSTMNGIYGINGMFLDQSIYGMTLQGKKSWFMFDDEVVALGSDISSQDGRNIETIVENRKLVESGNNKLYVNDVEMSSTLGSKEQQESTEWAHLSGNIAGSDIGYYFPEKENISFEREARTDSWKNINIDGSDKLITRNYLKMSIDHGVNPESGNYAYVLLPNKSKEDTATYAKNADIEIIANNEKVQAVKENKLNLIGANFWENEKTTVDKITSYHKASVMVKETPGDILEVSVSDPTHKNSDVVEIELDYAIQSPLWLDSRVSIVESTATKTKLAVNVKGAIGASINATFNLKENAAGWENDVIYSDSFEGTEGEEPSDWKKEGKGQATNHVITESLYSKKDFTGKQTFDPATGIVKVEYDFIPLSDKTDAVMAHGGESQLIDGYAKMPIIVRASANKFDAYNGGSYEAVNELTWEKDAKYHIRVEINVDKQSYSAFVKPENGVETQIAKDYKYRGSADAPKNIGQFILQDDKVDKGSLVYNYKVNGDGVGNVNQVMKVTSDDGEVFRVQKNFEPQQNRSIIEWSFMKEDVQESAFILAGENNESIRLEIKDNKLIDSLNNKVIISQVNSGIWYTLKVDLNAVTGKYNVYVNDDLIEKNLSWNSSEVALASESKTVLKSIIIETKGELYIDDISIVKTSVIAESLTIDSETTRLNVGEELALNAKVNPSNAFLAGIRWSSSDESIASVNQDGIVTGIKEGIVLITVHDTITGLSATESITVLSALELEKKRLEESILSAKEIIEDAVVGNKPGQYSQEVVDKLVTVIKLAQEILDAIDISQEEIDQTVNDLTDAIEIFEASVNPETGIEIDHSKLRNEIDQAEAKVETAKVGAKPGEWAQSSVDTLQKVIAKAKALLNDSKATQSVINDMVKELKKALKVFEKSVNAPIKNEEENKGDETDNNKDKDVDKNTGKDKVTDTNTNKDNDQVIIEKEEEDKKLPSTATSTYNLLLLGLVLLVSGLLFTIFRRKKI